MTRLVVNLNRDWRFTRGDPDGAAGEAFDDRAWQRVGLPHAFDLPYFRTPEFYVGPGWYRRRFVVDPNTDDGGRRWSLEFDGVFQAADVHVNGRRVGGHRGGYTAFSVDITGAVRPGENLLAIRADNGWHPQLAPRAGEHVFGGGIYRDVRLVGTGRVHVPWCGLRVTTPEVSAERAAVRVQTEVRNASAEPVSATVFARVTDPAGRAIGEAVTTHPIAADDTAEFDQFLPVDAPLLWHPDHPHVYRVAAEVCIAGATSDRIESPFGIRWFTWTADRGLFLNGRRLYLRGANAHQDHAGWGVGITRSACERDVRLMKEAGFNFIRGAHYPHHTAFADACDRLGLIFWSECVFWGKGGFGPEGYWNASAYPTNAADFGPFEQSCLDQLAEMVRTHFNHPSIVVWSMTNEAFFTYHLDRARGLMRRMVERCREIDPTRLTAIGGAQRGDVDRIADVAGYNGDGARLFVDPGVPNMVSEYGAISKPHQAFDPFRGDLQAEEFAWRGGEAIWCGFDYGSIAGRQGLKGIVDHQRVPKRSWDWYRKHLLGIEPAPPAIETPPARLHLAAERIVIRGADALEDSQITVTVHDAGGRHCSASPAVTLEIVSGPGEFPTGRSITFDAATDNAITLGRAAAAFRSYHGGRSLIRAASTGLVDATIEIETIGEPRWVEGETRPCDPRPYTPPEESPVARAAIRNAVNIALNRPSRATTESSDHPARLANDGDARSSWFAATGDASAAWTLDMEGFYELASVNLAFPRPGNWRFTIDTSIDGEAWRPAVDRRASVNEAADRVDVFDPGLAARYLRLTFHRVPEGGAAGLAEVAVFGILSVR